jgi:hypothetical protein
MPWLSRKIVEVEEKLHLRVREQKNFKYCSFLTLRITGCLDLVHSPSLRLTLSKRPNTLCGSLPHLRAKQIQFPKCFLLLVFLNTRQWTESKIQ